MTAARELLQIVVAEVLDHLAQARVGAEEVLTDVGARLDRVLLEVAVERGVHPVDEHAVDVACEQVVPRAAPNDLDRVPAHAAERRLEFLDHLAVAAHGAVEALEVAVDDEDEVVELLPRGDREGAECLGLVALAVAYETPDTRAARVLDAAVHQVAVEAGLVDGGDGGEAHRHRRELPELGHEPRMGIRREALAFALYLHAEVVEVLFVEPPLEEGACVDAGRTVALEVDLVAGLAVVLAAEEVVEADLVQGGRRGVRGQVSADARRPRVGPRHHHGGVPPDVGADAALDVLVAREPRLLLGRDGVDVRRADRRRERHLQLVGPLHQLEHQELTPRLAARVDHGVEGVEPLGRLLRVDIRELSGEAVEDHGSMLAPLDADCGKILV